MIATTNWAMPDDYPEERQPRLVTLDPDVIGLMGTEVEERFYLQMREQYLRTEDWN